jgi:signal transduction histidine kinase
MFTDSPHGLKNYAERLIAVGRVVLSAFILLAIFLDLSEPGKYENLASELVVGYSAYAVVLAFVVWRLPKLPGRFPIISHAIDLVVFSLFMYFTERPVIYSTACFTFFILSATVRWQWRGTLWTGAATLLVSIGLGVLAMGLRPDPAFEMNRLIGRSIYLAAIGALLGYLGLYQERLRTEISMLAAWPLDPPLEDQVLLGSLLKHACAILRAPRALMAWEEKEEPWGYLALWSADGHFALTREPPAGDQPTVAEPLSHGDFFCQDLRYLSPSVFHTRGDSLQNWRGSPLNPALQQRFAAESVLALKLRGESLEGYLFFLDRQGLTDDDLVLGRVVGHEVAARMDLFYLVQRLKQTAAGEARLRVSYDLHDGLLQSLAVVGMKLDTISRLLDEDPQKVREPLLEIDRLLSEEQASLRSFIRELKSVPGGADQGAASLITRLQNLIRQVERQWGLRVNFTTAGLDSWVAETLPQDIYYLVREALLNAARHAGASSVSVELGVEDRDVRITVADNGRGFSFRGRYEHSTLMEKQLGPVTLRGRIASLGGQLAIDSSDAGARLEIMVPCIGA